MDEPLVCEVPLWNPCDEPPLWKLEEPPWLPDVLPGLPEPPTVDDVPPDRF
jgi:hypothetical protein